MNKTRCAAFLLAALIMIHSLVPQKVLAGNGHQEGYPPPLLPTPTLAVPMETTIETIVAPYPSGGTDFNGQSPVPIGIESNGQQTESIGGNEPNTSMLGDESLSDRGLVFLWLGFLATFLVFLTSVFGSIILFTRRNES